MWLNFSALNPWAVLVAGLSAFFLGAVWYTALFGQLWIRLHGWSEEHVKTMQAQLSPALFFGGMILCYLLIALAMGLLVVGLDLQSLLDGATLGGAVGFGLAAALGFTGYLASDKPVGLFLIDAGFQLTCLLIIGVVLALWR